MSEKKHPYHFHLCFDEFDADQRKAALVLNEIGRRNMVAYITKAVEYYSTAKALWRSMTPAELASDDAPDSASDPDTDDVSQTGLQNADLDLLSQSMSLFDA